MYRLTKHFVLAMLISMSTGSTGFSEDITTVEEDWELEVGVPNATKSSPQLSFTISPYSDVNSENAVFATFLVNSRTEGSGVGGGLQVQIWRGTTLLGVGNYTSNSSLATEDEKIRWTQRMTVADGVLTVEIVNGTSTTWGNFGGNNQLIVATRINLEDLDSYDPEVSARYSRVTYGSQRVARVKLRKVRTYTGDDSPTETVYDRVVCE